jgi:hypothetical protein
MKNIKAHFNIIGFLISVAMFSSCDKGFDELNTNKVDPTSLNPIFVMNKSIVESNFTNTANTQSMLCYNYGIVQQIITPFGSTLSGANSNQLNPANSAIFWNYHYGNTAKQIVDAVEKTRDDPKLSNVHNAARIWKAYVFMMLTDTYGDIPYFEAAKGYLEANTKPKYDAQQDIYKDILKELEEASTALNPALAAETSDVLYGGSINNWKRFGYSLLLRAGMRLTKIDPALAEATAKKAVAGGLMQSNADNAVLRHSSLYINWTGEEVSGREKANFYLAAPFVNYLKTNNDPRLPVFSIRYVGAKNGTEQVAARATSSSDVQVGMPMGYNDVSIVSTFQQNNVVSLWDYSQGNQTTVLTVNSPEFFVTYAQTQLLLSEAIVRGWVSGDAASVFSSAVRANMEQMSAYGVKATIPDAAIGTYINAHQLNPATALNDINTQYWVASFLNGSESFANFRRSDYPLLTKNPFPGSEITEDFIRRLVYPDGEYVVNKENVEAANTRQGPDKIDTRVWWDKK